MNVREKSAAFHEKGFNCAQSVLAALEEYTGMDSKTALSLAGGLGGGLKSGEVCGAISGAVIALSLCFPYCDSEHPEDKDRIYKLAAQCVKRCREKCGKVTCRDLMVQEHGNGGCRRFVCDCAEIAEEMIKENK